MIKHDEKTKVRPNIENLPFKGYYESLKDEERTDKENPFTPLYEFLIEAARYTGKHPESIRRWAYGTAKPNKLERKAMAELLQCDADLLFPELSQQ